MRFSRAFIRRFLHGSPLLKDVDRVLGVVEGGVLLSDIEMPDWLGLTLLSSDVIERLDHLVSHFQ